MSTNNYRIFEVKWQTRISGYFHGIVKVNDDDDKDRTNCEILQRFPDSDAWEENDTIGIPIFDTCNDGKYTAIEYTKKTHPEYFI